ncbi:MAG: DUF3341 domain-containing protein [Silvibacterium sp.]|jgi:hypothetical protein
MSNKNTAVFGIYATPGTAEAAVDHLLTKGFTNAAISVLLPDDESTRAFAHQKSTKAPEGTATGATAGGVVGGTLGLLAGIGLLAIPGVGPIIAAGPIVAALAGIGAGGTLGGIVGALVGMGIPEYEAKRYEGAVKNGGTLLSVHCDTSEQIDVAKVALKDTGARDIASTGEASSNETAGARGTFGNIADGRPLSDPALANDARVVDREVIVSGPGTTKY